MVGKPVDDEFDLSLALREALTERSWDALRSCFEEDDENSDPKRFREEICFPVAVAWALMLLPWTHRRKLENSGEISIWIVGARQAAEGRMAKSGVWNFLAQVFPECSFDLALVGPEMEATHSYLPSTNVRIRNIAKLGHEFIDDEGSACPPDYVVVLNSGIGTMALPLVKRWLPTVRAMLELNVPTLFTCFGEKEKKGEELIIRHLFKASVLVDFQDNPFKPHVGDDPTRHRRPGVSDTIDVVEKDCNDRLCNAVLWWACGSDLSSQELEEAAGAKGLLLLQRLAQSFAQQGAYRGWLDSLSCSSTSQEVGLLALESLAAALAHPAIAQALAKRAKHIIDIIIRFAEKHGPNNYALECVEHLLAAKVRPSLEPDCDPALVSEIVRQTIAEQHGQILTGQPHT